MICDNCECGMVHNGEPIIVKWGNCWNAADTEIITYFDIEIPWKCPDCGAEETEKFCAKNA